MLNVVQGLGAEAGAALVEHPGVDLVSFTGSAATGRWIARDAPAARLAKVCLELGGKNALVVCDDADLDNAVRWAVAVGVLERRPALRVGEPDRRLRRRYDEFRERFVEAALGVPDAGPVISEASLERILAALARAREAGATVLCGGERLERTGWWLAPTVLEGVAPDAEISCTELFGPVTILYRVRDLRGARVVNDSPYGLTAAVHTASLHRAMRVRRAR